MKKVFVALSLVAALTVLVSCGKEKRCQCTTYRGDGTTYRPALSLEPLGSHASCSELDESWLASDSTGEMLKKVCVDYVE